MSESNIVPVTAQTSAVGTTPSKAPDATTAAAVAQSNADPSSTIVKDMGDLKRKAPKVYNQMMEGIGMNICNEMKHHQDRLKQLMREASRNG